MRRLLLPCLLLAACSDDAAPPPDAAPVIVPDADPLAPDAPPTPDAAAVPDANPLLPDAPPGSPDARPLDAAPGAPDAHPVADAAPPPDAFDPGPEILNPSWIGGPCTTSGDCPFSGGTCLQASAGYPGGMCTRACITGSGGARTCPDSSGPLITGTFCIEHGVGTDSCYSRCDYTLSDSGCRQGYVCVPEDRSSDGTYLRHVCVPQAGIPTRPEPAYDIGDPCLYPWDCGHNVCLRSLGGYCSQEACDVIGCPDGARCADIGTEEAEWVCLDECAGAAGCRTGDNYACNPGGVCWQDSGGACDLDGSADCAPYVGVASSPFVVVTKHDRRLTRCSGAAALGSYCVGGSAYSPDMDKEIEGDYRTPEGIFYVAARVDPSTYYRAFLLSYPDVEDGDRGFIRGLITSAEFTAIINAQNAHTQPPQTTALGSYVELHGGGGESDWTWGCIAADDSLIDTLYLELFLGDTIVVVK